MALLDQYLLAADSNFQGRVQASLLSACVSISNEGWTIPFHRERAQFCATVLTNPAIYVPLFSDTVATDANVISDATAAGTVVLTTTNRSTAASQVTDAHINAAVASQFNSFIREPA